MLLINKMYIMEKKTPSKLGRFSVSIGIVAGFVFLIGLFNALGENSNTSEVLTWVAIAASSIAIFLSSMEPQRPKVCETKQTKDPLNKS